MYIGDLVSRVVEKLAKYPAGTDCSEDAVGHMLDEEVGGGVAELSACKWVYAGASRSGHAVKCWRSKLKTICWGRCWSAQVDTFCCMTTEMQPRSHTVPPASFSMHVDMVLVPCVLRACVMCAIVKFIWWKIPDHDHFIRHISFHRESAWDWLISFFPRMAVSQTGFQIPCSAVREESPANSLDFFWLWERAAPATGRGRGRDSRWVGPRSIPRRPSRAAPRSAARGRRENAPPVEKTRFYFAICLVHIIYVYCCRCVSLKYISGTASTCSIWERKANTK